MPFSRGVNRWRDHPVFRTTLLEQLPGLRLAALAFTAYVFVEQSYKAIVRPPLKVDPSSLKWRVEGIGEKPSLQEEGQNE